MFLDLSLIGTNLIRVLAWPNGRVVLSDTRQLRVCRAFCLLATGCPPGSVIFEAGVSFRVAANRRRTRHLPGKLCW